MCAHLYLQLCALATSEGSQTAHKQCRQAIWSVVNFP